VHYMVVIVSILVFIYLFIGKHELIRNRRYIIQFTILFLMGLMVYLYLPIRAQAKPPLNYGDPSTIKNFARIIPFSSKIQRVLSREPKRERLPYSEDRSRSISIEEGEHLRKTSIAGRLGSIAGHFVEQYPFYLIGIGILGLILSIVKGASPPDSFLLIGTFLGTSVLWGLLLRFDPSGGRGYEFRVLYLPAFMVFSIWVAIGLSWIERVGATIGKAKERAKGCRQAGVWAIALILSILFLFHFFPQYRKMDRSRNFLFYEYGLNLMELAEPKAIIITTGDNSLFPILYLQVVEGMRRDITIVHLPLIDRPWYRDQLRTNDPGLILNRKTRDLEGFVEAHIPSRPIYLSRSTPLPLRKEGLSLLPLGVLWRFFSERTGQYYPMPFRPSHRKGLDEKKISWDRRELTILNYYPMGNLFVGNEFMKRGWVEKAIDEYMAGLQYSPIPFKLNEEVRKELLLNLGTAYFYAGNGDLAKDCWRRLLHIDPGHRRARQFLNWVEGKGM